MADDLRAMFAAKAVPAPGRGARDSISLFIASIKTQIKRLDDEIAGKPNKTTALNWFKPNEGGYIFQLGKKPIALGGATHWRVGSLEEVRTMLESATELARKDAEFQQSIREAAKKTPVEAPSSAAAPKPKRGRKAADK